MSEREPGIRLTPRGEKVKRAVKTLLATAAIAVPGGGVIAAEVSQGADQDNTPGHVEKTVTTFNGEQFPTEKSGGEAREFFNAIETNGSGRVLEGQWWFGDVNENGDKIVVNNPIMKATSLDESSVTVGAVYASEGVKTFTFDTDHFRAEIKSDDGEFHGVQDFAQLEQIFDVTKSDIMSISLTDTEAGWPSAAATITQESDLGTDTPAGTEQVYLGTMGTEQNVGNPAIG